MPTLKQLSCQIEWAGSNVPFKEYGTTYGDGYVESYIAIPNSSTPFSVILRSNGYIAPGLAMFVFMDGVCQCNRNRDDLRPIASSLETTRKYRDISFRVRQREERLPDGSWIGRPWRFERFPLVKSTRDNSEKEKYFERLGTIQIIVLRCAGHPRAKHAEDHDIPDGAHTPESGMAPDSEREDDDSISSEVSFIYEYLDGRFQEGSGEVWGPLGGLFDGPYDSSCYVQGPPYQQPVPYCCSLYHNPHDDSHPRSFGYAPGRNGGQCRYTWHAQQQPIIGPYCHVDHIPQETLIDAPHIPHGHTAHSMAQNPSCQAGCHNQRAPLNIHGNSSHPSLLQCRHTHKLPSSSSKNSTSNTFNGDPPPEEGGFFVPPIVLNINPQQFRAGTSHNERTENCTKSNDNGYYVISDGKRVPESSSCCSQEHISGDACSGANNHGKKKGRRNRRRSLGRDKQEQPDAADQNNSWEDNQDHQQDRCGVDGEATPSESADNNPAVNTTNNDDSQQDCHASDDNHQDSTWKQSANSSPNVQPVVASPKLPPVPPKQQIRNFSPSEPVFVCPMFSEPARDEPPLYTVPESVARADSLTHQVQFGPQAKYIHRLRTPEYLDTMEKPYAEFVFKYRTADVIQNKFHVTIASDIDEERRKLETLPRVEIVNQLLHAQGLLPNSDMNNNCSTRTSPQVQSRNERMGHRDNSNMNNTTSSRDVGGGNQPGWNTPSQPQREQWHQNGSSSSNAFKQPDNGIHASLNSKPRQESQNWNGANGGGSGEPSWMNQTNDSSSHSAKGHDNNNNSQSSSAILPTTNDVSGGSNEGAGNGAWESSCEPVTASGVAW
ncbi:hypothetical protein ACJ72_03971 [Emergomyces africanus]|uniref:Uncharacterized protein n=1 Tax=Emergomyces africanus TaxID=1955775 RepID=A0A1B7NY34_9EURO|nr:hypothetical protein ACJ72_03971 [Emergomyces africanus]